MQIILWVTSESGISTAPSKLEGGPGRKIQELARESRVGDWDLRHVGLAAVWCCNEAFLWDLTNALINKCGVIGEEGISC